MHALCHICALPQDGGWGLPPKVVQERLGHATINLTMDTNSHLFPQGTMLMSWPPLRRRLFGVIEETIGMSDQPKSKPASWATRQSLTAKVLAILLVALGNLIALVLFFVLQPNLLTILVLGGLSCACIWGAYALMQKADNGRDVDAT